MSQEAIPCVVYRGGTSRGIFFHEENLPKNENVRNQIFLQSIGAADASHVDGLGGGTSHTSKVVIIERSSLQDADVDYTFVQLGMGSNVVDFEGTCGNLMAAVGAFAVDEGLVAIKSDAQTVTVNVWSTNIEKHIVIQVPVKDGKARVIGDYVMSGVSRPSAKYEIDIASPGGGKTGSTLPLSVKAKLDEKNIKIDYTFSDIVNPFVFVKEADINHYNNVVENGLTREESIIAELEKIRKYIAVKSGLANNLKEATDVHIALPKVSFISEPKDYVTLSGESIRSKDYDIFAQMISVKKLHRTFAVSGLLNLASTCLLEGTIPYEVCALPDTIGEQTIRIGHPDGVATVRVKKDNNSEMIEYVGLDRTARRIMSGEIYIPLL